MTIKRKPKKLTKTTMSKPVAKTKIILKANKMLGENIFRIHKKIAKQRQDELDENAFSIFNSTVLLPKNKIKADAVFLKKPENTIAKRKSKKPVIMWAVKRQNRKYWLFDYKENAIKDGNYYNLKVLRVQIVELPTRREGL